MSYTFVSTTAVIDPSTASAYITYQAGRTGNPPVRCGIEVNCTLLRAFLIAATKGLTEIENGFGRNQTVDILIPDETIAQQVQTRKPGRSVLHGDDDLQWAAYFEAAAKFRVNIITNPGQSDLLTVFWGWHSVPLIQGELSESDAPAAVPVKLQAVPKPIGPVLQAFTKNHAISS